jgi:DNA-binding response OmpR family regulator
MGTNLLKDKKVLVVDDEVDVLETLEELLSMCHVVKASSFDEAKKSLENQVFDLAILDIMGVEGYNLLEIAVQKKVIAAMLTAHAFSPQDTVKSFRGGAAYYIPKDRMKDIVMYLTDILEAQEKGERFWWRWLDRFGAYYDKKFGPNWKRGDQEFWRNFGPWE